MKEVKVNIRHKLGKTTKIKQELNDKESLTEEQDKSIPGRLN